MQILIPSIRRSIYEDADLRGIIDIWKSNIMETGISLVTIENESKHTRFGIKGEVNGKNNKVLIYIYINCNSSIANYESEYPISSIENIRYAMMNILSTINDKLSEIYSTELFYGMCNEIDIGMHRLNTTYWKE